jgi:[ribosomal protein S18]-alanine N-acetyltransferase
MAVTGTVVTMTAAHIDLLMPYEHDMFGAEAWSAGAYRDEIEDTHNRYYIAVEGPAGELLGWAGVLVAAPAAELLTVGVVPPARRQGNARRLLANIYVEAGDRGATELFLEVRVNNDSARSLYESEGFVEVGRRRGYYDGGRADAVVMRRELTKLARP